MVGRLMMSLKKASSPLSLAPLFRVEIFPYVLKFNEANSLPGSLCVFALQFKGPWNEMNCVYQHSPKVGGFSRAQQFPPKRKVDKVLVINGLSVS